MAQYLPPTGDDIIALGARLTDYAGLDLRVEGLASGGMGVVVWGPDALSNDEIMALKLLKPERVAEASSREARAAIERQFETEALIWCHLWHHQTVITTNGLARLPGLNDLPVLVLEYAPRGSLRTQLQLSRQQRQPLPLEAALAWTLHIASALAHIHQRDPDHERPDPLIHCDLKPENVLLDAHGWAKLTDLGLTRAYAALAAETLASITPSAPGVGSGAGAGTGAGVGGAHTPVDRRTLVAQLRAQLQGQGLLPGAAGSTPQAPDTATIFATRTLAIPPTQALLRSVPAGGGGADELIGTGVAGSPPYMAPEQWRGLAAAVPATDVYALGVLLFELFAGYEAPYAFPRDPMPYLTSELYAHALATGYDPLLLGWHAAHIDAAYRRGGRGLGAHRLSDPQSWEAALRSGPCAELVAGGAEGRRRAETCLAAVDALVERCLTYAHAARPSAAEVAETLRALAVDQCGLEELQLPQAAPSTPRSEAAFWGNVGVTYGKLGQVDKWVNALRRALQHDSNDPVNWLNLGSALARQGEQARQAIVDAPQPEDRERYAAKALRAREEALDAYRAGQKHLTQDVAAMYPGLPVSLVSMEASMLGDLGRYGEAVEAYKRALELNPNKLNTRFNLALDLARWSQIVGVTTAEQVARLEEAQRELATVLDAAPEMRGGRRLADRIAAALADPAHRFQG